MKKKSLWLFAIAAALNAGPNAGARLCIDLDISTPQIDSVKPAATGSLMAGIVCKGVVNLDSYSFDIAFDTAVLSFSTAVEDNPLAGLKNILKKNNGQTLNVNIGLKNGCADTINFNNTLIGSDSAIAPEGDGLLGIVLFEVRKSAPCSVSVRKAIFLDYEGDKDTTMAVAGGRLVSPVGCVRALAGRSLGNTPRPQLILFLPVKAPASGRNCIVYDAVGRIVRGFADKTASHRALPAGVGIVHYR
jgi:hypothetical protein